MRRACALALLVATAARGDELSGADKQRMVWSSRFLWTRDGLPLVTVRVSEARDEITVSAVDAKLAPSGAAVRVLPDGEGGPEVRGGGQWKVRLEGAATPARVRYHVVVARAAATAPEPLKAEAEKWRQRGFSPHSFEVGTVFGVRGEVIDNRQLLLAVAPDESEAAAAAAAKRIARQFAVETQLHPEVVERARGLLTARDERGTLVQNDGVIWFAPSAGLLAVDPADRGSGGGNGSRNGSANGNSNGNGNGNGNSERRAYYGQIYVAVDGHGRLAAVNAVPEDKLLAGLLPAEIGAGAPAEAQKAQAVAARNELLAKVGTRHFTDPYRLCSSVHCQVYAGAGHEDPRATAAVTATRGELLVRADGSLIDAVYSSSCGGHTEDNDRAWGGPPDPALRGRLDADDQEAAALAAHATVSDVEKFLAPLPARPYCALPKGGSPFRWSARVPVATVEANAGVGAIREIKITARGVSGRAVRLQVIGEKGEKEVSGELTIRRLFGGLKSALFVMNPLRDAKGKLIEFAFQGGGHGHGIGLCQSGAMGMAERGRNYKEILQHYYRDATVRKLY